jgi:hypothetical protein
VTEKERILDAAVALVLRFQEIDARRHFQAQGGRDYGPEDTNVWGILDPPYQSLQRKAWSIMREEEEAVGSEAPVAEQSPPDYERMVGRLRDLLGAYVDANESLTAFALASRR